jgi:hypothetical protein
MTLTDPVQSILNIQIMFERGSDVLEIILPRTSVLSISNLMMKGVEMEQVPKEYQRNIQLEEVRLDEFNNDSIWLKFYELVTDKRIRMMVALIGALSTLLPWYFMEIFSGAYQYQNLFSGLLTFSNIGYQLGALLFYIGLLSFTFEGEEWSLLGGLIMAVAIIMSSLSVQDLPGVGIGMIIGILVIIYAFLPIIYAVIEVMSDRD